MSRSTLTDTPPIRHTTYPAGRTTPTSKSIQSLLHPHSPSPSSSIAIISRPSHPRTTSEPPDRLLDTRNGQMPASFANLLALHGALENALLLHLSTQGANVAVTLNSSHTPPSASDRSLNKSCRPVDPRMKTPEPEDYHPQTVDGSDRSCPVKTFRFENLITWPVIKPIVERASASKFSEYHLAQLLWLWQNDPEDLQAAQESSRSNHQILSTPHPDVKRSSKEQTGMGFIISSVRVLEGSIASPNNKRIAHTYGLGLEIKVRENQQLPTYSLESPGKSNQFLEPSPTRINRASGKSPTNLSKRVVKAREIMNLVALWSSKSVERKNEIASRLRSFWTIHSDLSPNSGNSSRICQSSHAREKIILEKNIKIPLGNLPDLDSKNNGAQYLTDQTISPSISNAKSSSKRKFSSQVLSPNSSFYSSSDDDDLQFEPCCPKRLKSHLCSPLLSKIVPSVNLKNVPPFQIKTPQPNSSVQLRALHLFKRIEVKEKKSVSSNLNNKQDEEP